MHHISPENRPDYPLEGERIEEYYVNGVVFQKVFVYLMSLFMFLRAWIF